MLRRSRARTCPSCGGEVERGWRHCASCGAPLRRPRWHDPVVLLAVAVVVLLLGGLSMAGAERQLADERQALRTARDSLRDSRELTTALRSELVDRVAERDALRTDLEKAKGSLSDAQRSVESQQQQLDTIKACLRAIEDIGIALDEGDERAAREAVDRANRHCAEASAFL